MPLFMVFEACKCRVPVYSREVASEHCYRRVTLSQPKLPCTQGSGGSWLCSALPWLPAESALSAALAEPQLGLRAQAIDSVYSNML